MSSKGGGFGGEARLAMPPGDYVVTLQVGETKLTQKARLHLDILV